MVHLGIHFDEKLSFREHMHAKINKAYMMFDIIERSFKYLNVPIFVLIYSIMVRSHLHCCSSVSAPYTSLCVQLRQWSTRSFSLRMDYCN